MTIRRVEQKLQFELFDNRLKALGFNLFFPSDNINLRRRLIFYIVGGPLANLLLALILYRVMTIGQGMNADYVGQIELWTVLKVTQYTFWLSIWFLLITLIPTEYVFTDGSKLVKLIRGGPHTERWLLITLTDLARLKGEPPRNWNPDWIKKMTEMTDLSTTAATALYYAYRNALDCKDIPQAGVYLSRMMKCRHKTPPALRASLLMETAFFEMYYRKDVVRSNNWLQQIGFRNSLIPLVTQMRWAAASLFVLNKFDEAEALVNRAITILNKLNDGISLGEKRLFEEILEQCKEHKTVVDTAST